MQKGAPLCVRQVASWLVPASIALNVDRCVEMELTSTVYMPAWTAQLSFPAAPISSDIYDPTLGRVQ